MNTVSATDEGGNEELRGVSDAKLEHAGSAFVNAAVEDSQRHLGSAWLGGVHWPMAVRV